MTLNPIDPELATLGHDLRSPLSGIIGLAALMREESADPTQDERFALISEHAQYMLDLVNGMVLSSKVGAMVEAALSLQFVSPWELAANVVRAANSLGRVPVRLDATTALPTAIRSDPLLVRQILTNLIGNATHATNEGGVLLQLHHEPGSDLLRLAVIDSGPGLSAAAIAGLFQADLHLARPEGHGLGLWISRRLATLLGGRIEVRTVQGRGTAMILELPTGPLTKVPLRTAQELRVHDLSPHSLRVLQATGDLIGRQILVADDSPANRLFAATVLKRRGASVTLAVDGEDALRRATLADSSSWPYDLVILDQHMPHHTGSEVARALRAARSRSPIVSWSSDDLLRETAQTDFAGHIPKPTTVELFVAHVAQFLRST